jgi:putative glycosyltransferase (TIGR04372 family)
MDSMSSTQNSQSARAQLQLGSEQIQKGDLNEALRAFQLAIDLDPSLAQAYFYIFQIHQHQGRIEQSLESLNQALQLDSSLVGADVHLALSKHYAAQGKLIDACSCCERAISIQPHLEEAHRFRADLLLRAGKVDQAIRGYKRMVALNPSLATYTNQVCVNTTLPFKIGMIQRELDLLTDAIDQTPEVFPELLGTAEVHFFNGNALAKQGALDRAIKEYEEAGRLQPNFAEAFYCLGSVFSALGNLTFSVDALTQAAHNFQKAISLRPDLAEAYFAIGKIYRSLYEHGQLDLEKALEFHQKAIELKPDFAEAYYEAWDALYRLGKVGESNTYIEKYVKIKAQRADNHPLSALGIRFITDFTYAVGHLAESAEVYLKSQMLGWLPERKTIVLAPPWFVANHALLDYWKKYFHIVTDERLIRRLAPLAKDLTHDVSFVTEPNGRVTVTRLAKPALQKIWEEQKRPALLELSEEDRTRGWKCLESLGMPRDAWFVTLHVREGGYKNEAGCEQNAHRAAEIETYYLAIRSIVERGGWVVRIGEASMKEIPSMPNVIDYAHSQYKSDWMDLFLCSQCKFYLASTGGIYGVVQLFDKPVCTANLAATPLQNGGSDIWIPKLARLTRENRLLTFAEMFRPPYLNCTEGRMLKKFGLEFIARTTEEINDLAAEMLDRLEGKCVYSAEDDALQLRFRALMPEDNGIIISRIGKAFLRKYSYLL